MVKIMTWFFLWLIIYQDTFTEYYLSESSKVVTGWAYINENWYLFNDSGVKQDGWLYRGLDSKGEEIWYYLSERSGAGWDRRGRLYTGYFPARIYREQDEYIYQYCISDTSGRALYTLKWSDDGIECYFYSPSGKLIKTLSMFEAFEEIWKLTGEETIWNTHNTAYTRNSSGVWEKF